MDINNHIFSFCSSTKDELGLNKPFSTLPIAYGLLACKENAVVIS